MLQIREEMYFVSVYSWLCWECLVAAGF